MRYAIGKVSGVFMEHDVAVKFFGIRGKAVKEVRGTIEECYARELLCLQRLQGTPGFPSIISHKDDDLILEMEDCGECLFNTWHEYDLTLYLDQANRICDALEKANIQYFFAGLNKKQPIKIIGIESVDLMMIHKSLYPKEESSYKLDDICEKYIGSKKIEYEGN